MLKRLKASAFVVAAVLNVAVILVMVVLGYAGMLSPVAHPRLAVMTLAFPFFLVADVAFLFFWLFVGWRWTLIPIAGLLACALPIRSYLPVNFGGHEEAEDMLKVVSYNVGGFNEGGEENAEANVDQVLDYLIEARADIVCLQEAAHGGVKERLFDRLHEVYKYYHEQLKEGSGDMVTIFSRYPIKRSQRIDYQSRGNISVACWLDVDGQETVVVNNHLETNKLSLDDRDNFKEIMKGDMPTQEAKGEGRMLLRKVALAAGVRAPQADAVSRLVASQRDSSRAVIVCGDFNDNPLSYTVRAIGQGLTDCYVSAGFGPGWSYHKNVMYVRIDHVFCSDEWEPVDAIVDSKIAASDHYPVVCWLKKRLKR